MHAIGTCVFERKHQSRIGVNIIFAAENYFFILDYFLPFEMAYICALSTRKFILNSKSFGNFVV